MVRQLVLTHDLCLTHVLTFQELKLSWRRELSNNFNIYVEMGKVDDNYRNLKNELNNFIGVSYLKVAKFEGSYLKQTVVRTTFFCQVNLCLSSMSFQSQSSFCNQLVKTSWSSLLGIFIVSPLPLPLSPCPPSLFGNPVILF